MFEGLAHVAPNPKLITGIFFFCHFDKYECMEKAGVQPEHANELFKLCFMSERGPVNDVSKQPQLPGNPLSKPFPLAYK